MPSDHNADLTAVKRKGEESPIGKQERQVAMQIQRLSQPWGSSGSKMVCWRSPAFSRNGQDLAPAMLSSCLGATWEEHDLSTEAAGCQRLGLCS